jgi:hypothetical protein
MLRFDPMEKDANGYRWGHGLTVVVHQHWSLDVVVLWRGIEVSQGPRQGVPLVNFRQYPAYFNTHTRGRPNQA